MVIVGSMVWFGSELFFASLEKVNTYWECGCAAVNPEAGDNDFSISEGLGLGR